MSRSYKGGKGDSNRVKDFKHYGKKYDEIEFKIVRCKKCYMPLPNKCKCPAPELPEK